MTIVTETVEINGKTFTHTYSDAGFMIQKTGTDEVYSDAYDVLDYTYEETAILIEPEENTEGVTA